MDKGEQRGRTRPGADDGGSVTLLLRRAVAGDPAARESVARAIHGELHRMARAHMARQSPGHTLQATALVNEVWLKVTKDPDADWSSRAHFLAVAALAMRQILVDHARSRHRKVRGSGAQRIALDDLVDVYEERSSDLCRFDEALRRLKGFQPEMAQAVELRFFGGAQVSECARILGMSKRTFERRWALASAWLRAELMEE